MTRATLAAADNLVERLEASRRCERVPVRRTAQTARDASSVRQAQARIEGAEREEQSGVTPTDAGMRAASFQLLASLRVPSE